MIRGAQPAPVETSRKPAPALEDEGREPAVLRIENLSVDYGAQPALREVSLEFAPRSITAIIGPSGSGKSTLLSCLNRLADLIPGTRVSGRVIYEGDDLYGPGVDTMLLRRRIGMIFQKPNPFPLSIRRNIELPLKEHGIRRRDEREAIMEEALRETALWEEVKDRLRAPATALSGGQQQRLCIARAIALKPRVLLMDEPCSALDPVSTARVEALIERLAGEYSVVIVTHHLAQARRLASRTALLWPEQGAGRLIEFAETSQLFSDPQHPTTSAYIEGRSG